MVIHIFGISALLVICHLRINSSLYWLTQLTDSPFRQANLVPLCAVVLSLLQKIWFILHFHSILQLYRLMMLNPVFYQSCLWRSYWIWVVKHQNLCFTFSRISSICILLKVLSFLVILLLSGCCFRFQLVKSNVCLIFSRFCITRLYFASALSYLCHYEFFQGHMWLSARHPWT